jgi:hypothetical protein
MLYVFLKFSKNEPKKILFSSRSEKGRMVKSFYFLTTFSKKAKRQSCLQLNRLWITKQIQKVMNNMSERLSRTQLFCNFNFYYIFLKKLQMGGCQEVFFVNIYSSYKSLYIIFIILFQIVNIVQKCLDK